MELSSRFAGTTLRSRTVTVNWRDIMNYAAAVGDNNPLYFDDTRESGIISPPMFCAALTWPISERMEEYIESDHFPAEVISTQVHYTEHIQVHRCIRPGDNLTISGKIAAIRPHRSGTHVVIRFDAADDRNVPVFTEHIGGLMRGVQCTGTAAGAADLPEIPRHQKKPPDMQWSRELFIDPLLPFVYDGCANIFFPVHTSARFARAVGLPGIILQGTATLALAVREVTNGFLDADPGKIRTIACRFTHMVEPGSRITLKAGINEKQAGGRRVSFIVENQHGDKAISDGCVTF
jgi:acyl dehydratase